MTAMRFSILEEAFAQDMGAECARRAGTIWALAPTNLLDLHLRRMLARRTGGVAGVQFLTLRSAARRLAMPTMAAAGQAPAAAGTQELVLQRLLEETPSGAYFKVFSAFHNAACAFLRAIEILEHSLWTPAALRRAAQDGNFQDPAAPKRLGELADIWQGLREWKDRQGVFTDDDLVREAAGADLPARHGPDVLFLYGFYDFTPAQRALVLRLIRCAERTFVYLLWAGEDAEGKGFEYADRTVQWLRKVTGLNPSDAGAASDGADLDKVICGIFNEYPFVGSDEAQRRLRRMGSDGSVRVLSCPGRRAETVEMARETLRLARDRDEAVDVGILLRDAAPYTPLLEEVYDRVGAGWYAREGLPLSDTYTGKLALSLLEVADGAARRADVVDFFGLAELDWPAGLSAVALDRLSRQAGIIKGVQDWGKNLRAHAAALNRRAQDSDEEFQQRALRKDAELAQTAAGFVSEFFQKVQLALDATWEGTARRLAELVSEYAPPDAPFREETLDIIRAMRRLDVTGVKPDPARVRWMLSRLLAQGARQKEKFQRVGITATSIMGARGVSFDTVILPGLVEKEFPRRIPEQPLLTDPDRATLNGLAAALDCGRLPLQARRPSEERYLMRIALGSARRAIVLTYPRLDQDKGRSRMASRFLGEVCSALAEARISPSMLEAGLSAAWFEMTPLDQGKWPEEKLALALDQWEHDAAIFSGAEPLRVGYMAEVSAAFARALRTEQQRWRTTRFGPYDGNIKAPELLDWLRQQQASFAQPISPTRFETYARCPFEYFLKFLLGLEEVEEPTEEFFLTAAQRGLLIHKLLKRLYERSLQDRPLGDVSDSELEALLQEAQAGAGDLSSHARALPAVWEVEREGIITQLRLLLQYERKEHAGDRPSRFEYAFEHSPSSLEAVPVFRGRIDRVDRTPEGGIHVIDYKTGRSVRYRKGGFAGGTQLQLPIYLLCAAELLGAEVGLASYLRFAPPADRAEFTLQRLRERMDEFEQTLRLIREGIAAGDFFPVPHEGNPTERFCKEHCPYGKVCGAARADLAEMKDADPALARLKELRAIE